MKVAIFSPYATVAPHFETELEIAERHLAAGDSVEFVSCTGELPNCDFNPDGAASRCEDCLGRRRDGLRMLRSAVSLRKFSAPSWKELEAAGLALPDSISLAALRNLRQAEFDIGQAVLSSLISLVRNPAPDLNTHRETLVRLWHSAASTFLATKRYLSCHGDIDRVYVFNGRFANMRAVLRASQAYGRDCWIHERGCDPQHFELYQNHLPHEIRAIEELIRKQWDAAPIESRVQVANRWYQDRQNQVESTWHSFTKGQTSERLPDGFDRNKHNLAIFCSSEDEFAAIGDCWRNDWFPGQADTIDKLCTRLIGHAHVQVYLRMHPNLAGAAPEVCSNFLRLQHSNLTIIEPAAVVDSYALMRACDTTITFGSTMGIEAAYWGKPSVLLGPCFYRGLGGTYQPASIEALLELCLGPIAPIQSAAADMYGYWQRTHGLKFEYVQSLGLFDALFKGERAFARKPKASGFHKFRRWLPLGRPAKIKAV